MIHCPMRNSLGHILADAYKKIKFFRTSDIFASDITTKRIKNHSSQPFNPSCELPQAPNKGLLHSICSGLI